MSKQRVNMDLDKELWKQVGMKAIELGMQKRELVETALKKFVNKEKEMEQMTNIYWEFDGYTVERETDLLRFENNEGEIIGYVAINDESIIEELDNGAHPIEDGWEDGIGNTISIFGWGEQAPQSLVQALERVRAIYETNNGIYGAYYETKEDVLAEFDEESFEAKFEMNINEVQFPIVTFDTEGSTDGLVLTSVDEVLDNAKDYFKLK